MMRPWVRPGTEILQGDSLTVLQTLESDSVDCVVTSPPYWGLRDYGVEGQLGLETTLGGHIDVMVDLFREVRRVLKPEGTLWLNYGDSYATAPNGRSAADTKAAGNDDRTFRDKPFSTIGPIFDPDYRVRTTGGIHAERRPDAKGRVVAGGTLKPKDLCGAPWRVALALQEDGWWLRQDIIWAKSNPMPESIRDRCTKAHEYMFLMTKSERYYFDADSIREACVSTDKRVSRSSHTLVDNSEVPRKSMRSNDLSSLGLTRGTTNQPCSHPLGRNKRSVWTIPTHPFPGAHYATFPPALVEPCILAGCPPGGLVLDPFLGSGTVGMVANRLGRWCLGIELSAGSIEIARNRIAEACA